MVSNEYKNFLSKYEKYEMNDMKNLKAYLPDIHELTYFIL